MFFILTKTVGFFASPSNAIMLIGILGLVLMVTRFARAGRRLAGGLSFLLLLIVGATPLGYALLLPLETALPAADASRGAPDWHQVVLGGVDQSRRCRRRAATVALDEAAERVTVVADLARRYPDARIVFTSGSANLDLRRPARSGFRDARTVRKLRRRALARHAGGALAQHRRERALHQGAGRAETGRALAPGDVGVALAACDRHVPSGGFSG